MFLLFFTELRSIPHLLPPAHCSFAFSSSAFSVFLSSASRREVYSLTTCAREQAQWALVLVDGFEGVHLNVCA